MPLNPWSASRMEGELDVGFGAEGVRRNFMGYELKSFEVLASVIGGS